MSALSHLWLLKQKGTLRNLFRKPASVVMTCFMVLVYGGLVVFMLTMGSDTYSMISLHQSILMSIGFTALIILTTLLQKRKAMFFEADGFYLFCSPFSKAQIMKYLIAQSALQAFLFALLATFMMICFAVGIGFDLPLLFCHIIAHFLTYLFFLMLVDYLYLLGIREERYQPLAKIVACAYIALALLLFVIACKENDFVLSNALMAFAQSRLFYLLPLFGWIKLLLIMVVEGNLIYGAIAFCLLVLANVVVGLLLICYQGDFYEQAMQDAVEMSNYMAQLKAGKNNARGFNRRVHQANVHFREGAGAIFSKNMLLMKKTRDFITMQDLLVLIVYFIISLFIDSGFPMFCYMIILWIFQVMQSSDLVNELKHHQIYLIPAKPFAKLWYALLPTLLKVVLLLSAAIVLGGLLYRMSLYEIAQYWLMLIGYASIFISATVLSIRILKSRTNQMLESMLRMLLTLLCAMPGICLSVYMLISGDYDDTKLWLAGNLSLILNLGLSFVILFLCKNMMNGRELNGD